MSNPFKAALAAKKAQVGLWLSMADPYLAEVSATAGFAPGPESRPQTKFERRGVGLGHRVWDVLFRKR